MKITLKDGSFKEYDQAMSVYDIAKDISEGLTRVATAGEVDGEIVDLRTVVVAEGKIKKDKHESVIFRRDNSHYEKHGSEEVCIDDKLPFEIPRNWEWRYLGNVAFVTKLAGFEYTK